MRSDSHVRFAQSDCVFVCLFTQDVQAEAHYYGSVKTVEKSLSLLLTAKAKALGDNVIPRGEVAEVTASCCASVAALTRVLYLFEERSGKGVRPVELVSVGLVVFA